MKQMIIDCFLLISTGCRSNSKQQNTTKQTPEPETKEWTAIAALEIRDNPVVNIYIRDDRYTRDLLDTNEIISIVDGIGPREHECRPLPTTSAGQRLFTCPHGN